MPTLESIHLKLDLIIQILLAQGHRTMNTLADLQAAVTATTTVQASAVTLIQGLAQELSALAAELSSKGVDAAAVEALATTLTTQASAFALAIEANTPHAAPIPTPTPAFPPPAP